MFLETIEKAGDKEAAFILSCFFTWWHPCLKSFTRDGVLVPLQRDLWTYWTHRMTETSPFGPCPHLQLNFHNFKSLFFPKHHVATMIVYSPVQYKFLSAQFEVKLQNSLPRCSTELIHYGLIATYVSPSCIALWHKTIHSITDHVCLN